MTSHIHVRYVDELSYIFLKNTNFTHIAAEVLASDSFITDCLAKIWFCKKMDFYFFSKGYSNYCTKAGGGGKSDTIIGKNFSSASHVSHIL